MTREDVEVERVSEAVVSCCVKLVEHPRHHGLGPEGRVLARVRGGACPRGALVARIAPPHEPVLRSGTQSTASRLLASMPSARFCCVVYQRGSKSARTRDAPKPPPR